jgi:hypothetical protein
MELLVAGVVAVVVTLMATEMRGMRQTAVAVQDLYMTEIILPTLPVVEYWVVVQDHPIKTIGII